MAFFEQSSRMNVGAAKKIASFIQENNIDIINCHGANPNFLHMFFKNKVCCKSVTTVHSDYRYDFINDKVKYLLFTPLNFLALRSFRNFICVSGRIKDELDKSKFTGEKYVVGNGVNISLKPLRQREEIRRELGIPEDAFVFTMVARFHPIKNHAGLIKAAKRLIEKHGNGIGFMLVGSGEYEEDIKSLVRELNLEDFVVFTGHQQYPLDYINAGDINILTSFNETFPIVILEGALAEKAAICSDVGDIREFLNSTTGFIVNPYSVMDIYEKMEKAYSNHEILAGMGKNLYTAILENYSLESFCERYQNAYLKILTGDKND